MLSGFTLKATPESGDKVVSFSPFGVGTDHVLMLRAPWNEEWFTSLRASRTPRITTTIARAMRSTPSTKCSCTGAVPASTAGYRWRVLSSVR